MIKFMKIDWMEGWANSPRIIVELDKPQAMWPDKNTPAWVNFDGYHVAYTMGIITPYFYTDGNPTQGFGGRVFEGTFTNGKSFRYIGAWSSRAACINSILGFPRIVDVVIGSCAIGVRAASIIEYFKNHRDELPFGLAWVDSGDMSWTLEATRDGKLKNDPWERSRIVEHI